MNLHPFNWNFDEVIFRYSLPTHRDSFNMKFYFFLLLQLFITLFPECCEISREITKSSEIMESGRFCPDMLKISWLKQHVWWLSGTIPFKYIVFENSRHGPEKLKRTQNRNPNNESSSENQQWFLWNKNENIACPDCDLLLEWKWLQICVLINQLQALYFLQLGDRLNTRFVAKLSCEIDMFTVKHMYISDVYGFAF